jgi:hypothetical protein
LEIGLVQTIIGAIISVSLIFIANRSGKILDNISTMQSKIGDIRKDVDNFGEKVNLLFADYNRRRDQEILDLRERVKEYESR